MSVYSCRNCGNLKTRVIAKKDVMILSRQKIMTCLKKHEPELLELMFPFNMTVYKRVMKDDQCRIIYCAQHQFKRDLYIFCNTEAMEKLLSKKSPCRKYE
ncbi:MAG TPA: hypothetical protein PLH56_00525 [Candidatus Omnitrophota bacterium]|nr:hypothetical protein [Candidatus Omnitrophota bacterium]HPN87809.1 hypothetical protein [Candidatus Omnitrophota bacterium]